MFLYLIIGVIVLSSVLALAGVSVTETIAVPDAVEVVPDYYEDAHPADPRAGDDTGTYEGDWHLEEVTIPIRRAPVGRGHPLHLHVVRARTSPASASSP